MVGKERKGDGRTRASEKSGSVRDQPSARGTYSHMHAVTTPKTSLVAGKVHLKPPTLLLLYDRSLPLS
jgi:hypothetical protein